MRVINADPKTKAEASAMARLSSRWRSEARNLITLKVTKRGTRFTASETQALVALLTRHGWQRGSDHIGEGWRGGAGALDAGLWSIQRASHHLYRHLAKTLPDQ